jgi:alkylhydroperoxidase family enzyme
LVRKGLTEQMVSAALGPLDGAELPAATVAALRLADALTAQGVPTVAPQLWSELRRHYDEGQILELGCALAVASGWQRMIEAFGIRPDIWSEATPSPPRPG